MIFRKKGICLLLILALCMNFMPGAVFAAEEVTEETTIPTEAATEPAEETTTPTEGTTEPTEGTTEPTEGTTEPTEEATEPTEEPTTPTEETTAPTEETTIPTEETEPPTEPDQPEEEAPKGWGLYFGQLHSHTDISDGTGTVEEAFAHATGVPNLDFLAVTDHSESISGAMDAVLTEDMTMRSADWAAGKAAAAAATNRDFVGIYGFEMTWRGDKGYGHINTFHTPGFVSWQQPAFSDFFTGLNHYCTALAAVPGAVSQFNHPGPEHGDFRGFSEYSATVDNVVQLLEVGSGRDPYRYYTLALDYGWHVAPTCNQNNHYGAWGSADSGRTVVMANSLTEAGIYEALRNHRSYATWDSDLHIYFDRMGSRLARRNVGRELTLAATVYDPTDAIGTVEVIVNEGAVAAAETLEGNHGEITFAVPADYDYYYLRIIQPDGDTAVTAPIWLEGEQDVGITSFTCDTNLPIQGRPLSLSLTLHNGDFADLLIERIDFSIGGEVFHSATEVAAIPSGEDRVYTFTPTLYQLGMTQITATVTASLEGQPRVYENTLSISLRRDDMVTDILVDAAHGNAGTDKLKHLELLAAENRVGMTLAAEPISAQMLAKAGILLVNAPTEPFSQSFVQAAAEFAQNGGTVILCGRSAALDGDTGSAEQLNRILAAAGATMAFRADTALDELHNGGEPDQIYPIWINTASDWCENVSEDQVYRHISGCTVAPGSGTWLVKGQDTTHSSDSQEVPILLAWEKLAGGGQVFAAGSLWLLEEELTPPRNLWDDPYANCTIAEAILGITPPEITVTTIKDLIPGEVCTIRGYVTAGTARAGNIFPDTIYLQDNTGGIAVTPFSEDGISVGTPLEVVGYLETVGKNRQFHPISWEALESNSYRFEGLTGPYREMMNNSLHGGEFLQIEGTVERVQLTEDGILSQIILRDKDKNYATVLVEEYIVSGSTGKNELAEDVRAGQEVRAFGILHMHTDGTSVLRVRNCDEVIIIDPWPYTPNKIRDKTNPRSGDPIYIWLGLMALSGGSLLSIQKRKKKLQA